MNEKMIDILDILAQEKGLTQRTGISLGLVNILIKKCAKKGLLKIERINSRNIRYILTPEGITEMTKRTINYVKRSYQAIQEMQSRMKELVKRDLEAGKKIFILKEKKDEIFDLVQMTLNEFDVDYTIIDDKEKIFNLVGKVEKAIIYHWDSELKVEDKRIEMKNIFM